jgi:hypothetical protein
MLVAMKINTKPMPEGNKDINSFQVLVGYRTWFQLMEENFYGSISPSKYGGDTS